MSEIHVLGGGISQAIGTGGRDLKSEVSAITAHQALDLLGRDPETKVIVMISKPPSSEVATKLLAAAQATRKPVVVNFIGFPASSRGMDNLNFAMNLTHAASLAVELAEYDVPDEDNLEDLAPLSNRYLRGLFSGGTLAYEATLALQAVVSPLYSNTPMSESQKLVDPLKSRANTIIDLGDDIFMVGRLHPMIDNDMRIRRLRQEAEDPGVGLILLDVVLGEGAHPDPASEFVPVIEEIKTKKPELEIVAIVIGTDADPQKLGSQANRLREAGAVIFPNVESAVDYIARRMRSVTTDHVGPISLDSLRQPFAAINVGLESFYESLTSQGAQAVHVEWRPPAGGNERLASLLAKMKK
jgi:FdrA protein